MRNYILIPDEEEIQKFVNRSDSFYLTDAPVLRKRIIRNTIDEFVRCIRKGIDRTCLNRNELLRLSFTARLQKSVCAPAGKYIHTQQGSSRVNRTSLSESARKDKN